MTLREYIEKLQKLVKENPETEQMLVVYSADDEGNSYQKVYFDPVVMKFENLECRHIEPALDDNDNAKPAVCIN